MSPPKHSDGYQRTTNWISEWGGGVRDHLKAKERSLWNKKGLGRSLRNKKGLG